MQRSSGEHVLLQSATSESHLCVGRASARARWHADARARGRAGASVRACGRVCFASSLCACVCVSHLGPLAVVIAVGEVVQPSHVHLDETSGARVQSLFILFYFILFVDTILVSTGQSPGGPVQNLGFGSDCYPSTQARTLTHIVCASVVYASPASGTKTAVVPSA